MESKLKQARKACGWTQGRLAEELCALCDTAIAVAAVDYTMVSKWERGLHKPSPYYQEKLCALYRASPIELGFVEENDVKRRTALKIAGAGMVTAMFPGWQTDAYEETLTLAWNTYYTGQITTIEPLLTKWGRYLKDRSTQSAGREKELAQTFLCRFQQLAGVVAREQGDVIRATLPADEAVLLAHHLKNADLLTTASVRKARLLVELNEVHAAVLTLEQAASSAKKAQGPARGYFMMYLAELYSRSPHSHQQYKAFKLLDDVEGTLRAKGELAGDGSFMRVDTNGFHMLRAGVFRRYGEYAEAETSLNQIDSNLGTRWQGNLFVAKAELADAKHDYDAVKGYAKGAAVIAEQTGSATMKKKALAFLSAAL